MRFMRVLAVAIVILTFAGGCWGSRSVRQDEEAVPKLARLDPLPPAPGAESPVRQIRFGPPVPETARIYRAHIGDRLEISIVGEPDMTSSVIVLPGGTISYAGEYNIQADGRTEEDIAKELRERLKRLYVSPRVSVRVVTATGNAMTVFGVVRKPGTIRVTGDTTITSAVALAGGVLPGVGGEAGTTDFELADLSAAWLRRRNAYVDVDFVKLFRGTRAEQLAHDVQVYPGDKLYIPSSVSLENKVFILGEVANPKVIRYRGDIRFAEALAESGIRPKGARWHGIALVRNGLSEDRELRVVNAAAIVRGRRADFKLQAGDIIYVPRTPFQTLVGVTRDLSSIFSSVRSADATWTGTRFDRER